MMNVNNASVAFALSEEKEAAIYFDHVIIRWGIQPFTKEMNFIIGGKPKKNEVSLTHAIETGQSFAKSLLPKGVPLIRDTSIAEHMRLVDEYRKNKFINEFQIEHGRPPTEIESQLYSHNTKVTDDERAEILMINDAKKYSLSNLSVYGKLSSQCSVLMAQEPAIQLAKLKLIDTKNTSWEHIFELRKDKNATIALRKLKQFWRKELINKEQNEALDELQLCIYEYDKSAKKWGLDTTLSTLQVILSKENTLSIAAILGGVFGQVPLTAAIVAGALGTVGTATVNVVQSYRQLQNLQTRNPAQFLRIASDTLKEKEEK